MTLPSLLLALLIASLCGVLFHIVRGGSGWRLLLYLGLSTLGFTLAQWLSLGSGWNFFMFGALDIGLGVIGSVVIMILGEWVSHIEVHKESGV